MSHGAEREASELCDGIARAGRAAMQTAGHDGARAVDAEDRATHLTLDTSVCDEVAELVREVREALRDGRYGELRQMAHPLAMRHLS